MLNKDTFVVYAMKAYDNPSCKTLIEFEEDLGRFTNLLRICSKDIEEDFTHLLLNQTISLLNVFENETCIKLMFFKIKQEDWSKLKTILVYLNRMPDEIQELHIKNSEIKLCQKMIEDLRKI